MTFQAKRASFIGILCAVAPGTAFALPAQAEFSSATDAAGAHLFLLNPSTFLPKSFSIGLGEAVQSQEIKLEDENNGQLAKIENDVSRRTHMGGFMVVPSAGFGLGLTFANQAEESKNTNDQSFWREVKLEETRVRREFAGRLTLEFTKDFRVGALFRYQLFRGDVIGSYGGQPDERSSYKGTLYGGGVGFTFVAGSGAVGAAYLMPLRGKVKVQGESKVTTDPGAILAQGAFEPSKNFRFGLSWTKWMHDKDELAQTSTGPLAPTRNTQIVLLGVNSDTRFYRTNSIAAGLDALLGSELGVHVTLAREQGEYVFDPEELPGESENEDEVVTSYRGRGAVFLRGKDIGLQLGAEYDARKHTRTPSETQTQRYKAQDLSYFATVNLGL